MKLYDLFIVGLAIDGLLIDECVDELIFARPQFRQLLIEEGGQLTVRELSVPPYIQNDLFKQLQALASWAETFQ